jgi:hypothetical protein
VADAGGNFKASPFATCTQKERDCMREMHAGGILQATVLLTSKHVLGGSAGKKSLSFAALDGVLTHAHRVSPCNRDVWTAYGRAPETQPELHDRDSHKKSCLMLCKTTQHMRKPMYCSTSSVSRTSSAVGEAIAVATLQSRRHWATIVANRRFAS